MNYFEIFEYRSFLRYGTIVPYKCSVLLCTHLVHTNMCNKLAKMIKDRTIKKPTKRAVAKKSSRLAKVSNRPYTPSDLKFSIVNGKGDIKNFHFTVLSSSQQKAQRNSAYAYFAIG